MSGKSYDDAAITPTHDEAILALNSFGPFLPHELPNVRILHDRLEATKERDRLRRSAESQSDDLLACRRLTGWFKERLAVCSFCAARTIRAGRPGLAGFDGVAPWRPPNFNEANVADKPLWVQALKRFDPLTVDAIDEHREHILESLQAVDRAVLRITQALRARRTLQRGGPDLHL